MVRVQMPLFVFLLVLRYLFILLLLDFEHDDHYDYAQQNTDQIED